MTTASTRVGIVAGVDGSVPSSTAVAWAARDAELRDLPLLLVHVVPPIVMPATPWPELPVAYARHAEDRARQITQDAFELAFESAAPHRVSQLSTAVLAGSILSTLIELSERAETVVTGCRGESAVTRALMGSVSSGLVHRAHCPVAIIHGEHTPSPQAPVVVGIDGSPASESAAAIAFDEASRRNVELVALHAWTDMGPLGFPEFGWAPIEWRNLKEHEESAFNDWLSSWRSRYPDVAVRSVVVCDRPAGRLLEHAQTAQLIVVGSHGRGAAGGMLLGSVSSAVVQSAQIPVIVARQG